MTLRYEPFDWYETPLYYDIIFDADTQKEADFLEALLQRHVPGKKGRILEPACGSGRIMAELGRRGHSVTGYDISEPMVAFAKARFAKAKLRAPRVRISVDRMESFTVPEMGRYDLGYCVVSTFKYLMDDASARAHLQRMAKALRPGGIYVIGFHLTDYTRKTFERERWIAERGRSHVVCNIYSSPPDRKSRTEKVRSRLIVTEGKRVRGYETSWTFRTYDNKQFLLLLKSVPDLELVDTHDFFYDADTHYDFAKETDGVVVVLRKRK